ncbi:MAG: hypothetical protein E7082_08630 [Bacteroidales bacterium]|nr:hypothetical protein [Bacteroidales bacterium]
MLVSNEEILSWLNGEAPDEELLQMLQREMPAWLLPVAMRLRNCPNLTPEERAALTTRLAAGASDIEQMSMAANADLAADLARFYPIEQPSTLDTEETIEKFLSTYGTPDKHESEMLERLIFNPTPDYAQLLAQEEEASVPKADDAPEGSADALINSFIIKSKASGGQFPTTAKAEEPAQVLKPESTVKKPTATDDAMLSESLAQVYIKRGKYSKAFEIISHLNLNFPEKSIYFADQLRFLRTLIALEERINTSKK